MFDKIFTNIRKDDLLHILFSVIIMTVLKLLLPWWIAALLTILIGILKELIWDKWLKKGTPEWRDLLSDIIGIIIGVF